MGTRKPGRRLALLAGLTTLALAAFVGVRTRDDLRAWYVLGTRFEKLERNVQGYEEYRHVKTGIVFVLVPGGTGAVGCTEAEWESYLRRVVSDEFVSIPAEDVELEIASLRKYKPAMAARLPRREVRLDPFLVGKFELTGTDWELTMGSTVPSDTQLARVDPCWLHYGDIDRFCSVTGLSLPSEAQWEHAALGGIPRAEWKASTLRRVEWKLSRFLDVEDAPRHNPNGYGLRDVFGSVVEACLPGASTTPERTLVKRGGSGWDHSAQCGIESRIVVDRDDPDVSRFDTSGVRLVFNLYDR